MQKKWNCMRWMLPLIWTLQNKEKRTPIWQRNVCLTLFILHENWGFHTVTHTSRPSPSSCLFRFFTIELSVISKKHIKPLLIGHSELLQAFVQSEAKRYWYDIDTLIDMRMNFYCHEMIMNVRVLWLTLCIWQSICTWLECRWRHIFSLTEDEKLNLGRIVQSLVSLR